MTKSDYLRVLGIKLNPYDWFHATSDLVQAFKREDLPVRWLVDDADILVIRFGLEGFAVVQKAVRPKNYVESRPDLAWITAAEPTRKPAAKMR